LNGFFALQFQQCADFNQNFRDLLFVHALEFKRLRTDSKGKVGENAILLFRPEKCFVNPVYQKDFDRICFCD